MVSIFGQHISIVETASCLSHPPEEGAVEGKVVAITQEVIVASERCVSLDLVVTLQARLTPRWGWVEGRLGGSITADGQSLRFQITISESQTKQSKEGCEAVSDAVQILLGVKFVEGWLYRHVRGSNNLRRHSVRDSDHGCH